MKQGKVVGMIKRAKSLIVLERDGEQWIGPGGCYWRMDGAPLLTKPEEFFSLYDVKRETGESYYTDFDIFPAELDHRDFTPGEEEAQPLTATVTWKGVEYRAFRWQSEILFCRAEYLTPAERKDGEIVQHTVRRSERLGLYIAVKEGLFLAGIVFPSDMGADNKLDFAGELVDIAGAVRSAQKRAWATESGGEYAEEYADQQTLEGAT